MMVSFIGLLIVQPIDSPLHFNKELCKEVLNKHLLYDHFAERWRFKLTHPTQKLSTPK